MPQMYCECCHKNTPHKVVMERCEAQHCSLFQSFASFFVTVLQGDHYVKMEQQYYCRSCNHHSPAVATSLTNANVA
ncbi:hypothetical protein VII00023_14077 [Vibrio ichthyoenteri ATCC 700023]|uniref:Uncharacterized protein n=1 Tax=Vibrio ichthyoenteri ATCC 700023 TaxID=870968 RepID=F9S6I2_9VIBR|nr:hypothetical protein [Vibrio ichthyoenteri]EGU33244.1 hypothetical protein VII00023_14077 [Vibrio ichthyoenteri ATCC 700023]